MRYLVTGGAGFVGSQLSLFLKRDHPGSEVVAFDNLHRKGSELNLPRLKKGGVKFVKGDVRQIDQLIDVGPVDFLIECSAEPSVHAGYGESPAYLIDTNLLGAINCLEFLRQTDGVMVFISTSRVYPIQALRDLPTEVAGDRLDIAPAATGPGWSAEGISEDFTLDGVRSLYGTTKLSAELLIQEYSETYDLPAIINRCGVIAGPWQMGKVDQGFVSLWVARHLFGGRLNYMGFNGEGRQVRDILHPEDLYELLRIQMREPRRFTGATFNVGGGRDVSVSLRELTGLCGQITGQSIDIGRDPETRTADIAYYVSDCRRVRELTGWKPQRGAQQIVEETHLWLQENRSILEPVFCA